MLCVYFDDSELHYLASCSIFTQCRTCMFSVRPPVVHIECIRHILMVVLTFIFRGSRSTTLDLILVRSFLSCVFECKTVCGPSNVYNPVIFVYLYLGRLHSHLPRP